jgi:hypothetical protein
MALNVTVRGPLFSKKIDAVVKAAMIDECMRKIQVRLDRPPPKKLLGMRRNPVRTKLSAALGNDSVLTFEHVESRFHSPRRTGSSWTRKNVGIIKAMAPRVLRKAAKRITEELG